MNKKIIMIAVQVLVLVAAVGGTWFFMHEPAPEPVAVGADGKPAAAEMDQKKEPEYYSLSPSFVVNLQNERGIRFLMIEIDLMTRKDDVFSKVEQYEPRIRNDLLMLFSKLDREAIATAEQRQTLQNEALATINGVLKAESGKPGVEAVYFTKFVVQ
ncbi:flagellar basal body-associated FliL family protein [Zhongshania aquimaris]|uniref:Flagellar protein FliL n=1 Tax=Zhongshania aquimaris TaxID=2857107 RepID=A0ABS6VTE5_9GAMM|nr:flagellar basal body-associated FliL family protein [Zhongshania aquimaris]MBW2941595.1 flagellar basal body-associated FliL family protein [Zhongshania aquimaris]